MPAPGLGMPYKKRVSNRITNEKNKANVTDL